MSTAIAVTGAQKYLKPIQTEVKDAETLPYVTFAFKMSDKWDEMAQAIKGLQPTNPVYCNGTYQKLDPFKGFLVSATQIWVEREQGREAKRVSTSPVDYNDPRKEEIHAVMLVQTPDGLKPATVTFKKGACKGAKTIVDELNVVSDPQRIKDWIGKSPDHKAAAAIPFPLGRFVATIKAFMKPPKGGGNPYLVTQATCSPTTAAEAAQLAKFFTDEEAVAQLNAIDAFNQNRLSELRKLEDK